MFTRTHKLNRMPVPDTLHLSVSYLIIPWGTIGMRDSLNKRGNERERKRERRKNTRRIWIWQRGSARWRDWEWELEGAEIKNGSDSVWINSVLRYSFGLCWGSRSEHTLCFSLSVPLSCSLCIHISPSLSFCLLSVKIVHHWVSLRNREVAATSFCYSEDLDGRSERGANHSLLGFFPRIFI